MMNNPYRINSPSFSDTYNLVETITDKQGAEMARQTTEVKVYEICSFMTTDFELNSLDNINTLRKSGSNQFTWFDPAAKGKYSFKNHQFDDKAEPEKWFDESRTFEMYEDDGHDGYLLKSFFADNPCPVDSIISDEGIAVDILTGLMTDAPSNGVMVSTKTVLLDL